MLDALTRFIDRRESRSAALYLFLVTVSDKAQGMSYYGAATLAGAAAPEGERVRRGAPPALIDLDPSPIGHRCTRFWPCRNSGAACLSKGTAYRRRPS
ncbi:MAG: hypothetical protein IPQ21_21910 [Betaproteobacteria bacterium]|nr:hypothetical protein [Betaproteobacteria bacterium]